TGARCGWRNGSLRDTARRDRDQAEARQRRCSTRRPGVAAFFWIVDSGWWLVAGGKHVQRSYHHPRSTIQLSGALPVHHLGRERLRLGEVDEVLIRRFVGKQHREVLQHVGGHRRRHATEERSQLFIALAMFAIETQ